MVSSWYREFMAAAGVNVGSYKPNPRRYTGPPLDLANMRENSVRSLYAWCLDCGHDATLNVDHYGHGREKGRPNGGLEVGVPFLARSWLQSIARTTRRLDGSTR